MQEKILAHSVSRTTHLNSAARRNTETPLTQPSNGVIYCRVSSKEQIEGTSLESQETACEEYARTHDIKVLKVFVERGESAKAADRTQLVELIDFCRNSKEKAQALIVWKLDRFARNVSDHFSIKATLMKYGVRVVSVTEPIDNKPEGKLMETILAGFAQFDNDIRATRTVQGMRRRVQEGIFPWKPPLGYKSAARGDAKKTSPDEPDQPLFGLLQKAWKEFATGIHKKSDIQRLMDSWGVQTASGISMTAQSLDNFFRNPYYAGILVDPWSSEEYVGKHVPMVSREVFQRVQAILSRRSRAIPHHKERLEFPLRGLTRCAVCLQYLTGGFSKGRSKRYAYYNCGNRKCPSRPSHPTHVVHEEFGAFLDQIAPKPEVITSLGERILRAAEERQADSKTRRERKHAELARLDTEVQELVRMRTQGLITDEEFVKFKVRISERQLALTDMATPDRFDGKLIHSALTEITQPLLELRATWSSIPPGFQRRFNHMVLPVGFVFGNSRTAELGPLFRSLGGLSGMNSHVVPLTGERLNQLGQAIKAFAELFGSIQEEKKAA
jgi:site-specific DNA recombinase